MGLEEVPTTAKEGRMAGRDGLVQSIHWLAMFLSSTTIATHNQLGKYKKKKIRNKDQ